MDGDEARNFNHFRLFYGLKMIDLFDRAPRRGWVGRSGYKEGVEFGEGRKVQRDETKRLDFGSSMH